jgi:GxxExxY protein
LIPENLLTYSIIGTAIEVHRLLGPGLLESAYEECLCHELPLRDIPFQGVKLDSGYRLDLLIANQVVVELKAIESLCPLHEAIMLTYLRLSDHHLGLLIKFNVVVLKDGIRRYIL